MSPTTIYLVCGVLLVPCLINPMIGFGICLVMGFLQEPIRKLLPGEPVYVTVLVGVYVAATFAGILLRGHALGFRPIFRRYPSLETPALIFALLVFIQTAATFARTGNVMLAGIGILTYAAPLPTFLLGFYLVRTEADVRRYVTLYIAGAVLMLTGVYLTVMGLSHQLLGAVGAGLFAYSPMGGILDLHPGFFRGSELAGWHGSAAAALAVVLVLSRRNEGSSLLAAMVLVFLLLAVVFTGRRKFLVEFGIFVGLVTFGVVRLREGRERLVALALGLGLTLVVAGAYLVSAPLMERVTPYYVRTLRVEQEAPERLEGLTVGAVRWIVQRNGLLGAGAGMGSQGAQYFGGGSAAVGSAAEGGAGKVLAELGVPGVGLLGWLVIALFRSTLVVIRDAEEPRRRLLAVGLSAFLLSNVAVFLIAHQIFGDIFVLLVLGWIAGVVLAIPRMRFGGRVSDGVEIRSAVSGGAPSPYAPAYGRSFH